MSIALRSMGGVVSGRPGEARIPWPIVVGESSQYLNEGLAVNDVEAQRCYAPWVEPLLGRTGQSIAQSVEHRPEVAHQVCSHPPGPRAQKAREGMKQGFEATPRHATDGEHAGDPQWLPDRGLKR